MHGSSTTTGNALPNPAPSSSRRRDEKGDGPVKEMRQQRGAEADVVTSETMTRVVIAIALTATLGVIGFLVAGSVARSATETNVTVALRKTALGPILVNSKGRTLYMFAKDRNGKSACNGGCPRFWPPLLSQGKPTAGPGLKPSLLGTTTRSNGSRQVTYNKRPLYTYVLDKRAGQTKGEGISAFGARWYAVSASGRAVLKASTTTTTTSATPYP
jgi:predicted lipoprotein with Yx(FWY)xxD motif